MEEMNLIISSNLSFIVLGITVAVIMIFIITIINNIRVKKLLEKYNLLTQNSNTTNIEELITGYYNQVNESLSKNRDILQSINKIESQLSNCTQKIGVVRYNAFDNVGSDLSFTVAILDAKDNGIVLNGVYSRESSTTYAKPVIDGKSKYSLSAEEIQAIDLAKRNYSEKVFLAK